MSNISHIIQAADIIIQATNILTTANIPLIISFMFYRLIVLQQKHNNIIVIPTIISIIMLIKLHLVYCKYI